MSTTPQPLPHSVEWQCAQSKPTLHIQPCAPCPDPIHTGPQPLNGPPPPHPPHPRPPFRLHFRNPCQQPLCVHPPKTPPTQLHHPCSLLTPAPLQKPLHPQPTNTTPPVVPTHHFSMRSLTLSRPAPASLPLQPQNPFLQPTVFPPPHTHTPFSPPPPPPLFPTHHFSMRSLTLSMSPMSTL